MNVSLTKKQQKYIASQITSVDYQNASELVRDALRLHKFYRHKVIEDLRAAIAEGWDGAASEKSVAAIIQEKQTKP